MIRAALAARQLYVAEMSGTICLVNSADITVNVERMEKIYEKRCDKVLHFISQL